MQKNDLVREAFASDIAPEPEFVEDVSQPDIVQNENTLVAQNPDSISELLKKQVKVYKTGPDDTLGGIARKFGISIDTIKWANNLPNNTIKENWDLLIPQTDGLIIEAGPNTTLEDIATKYKGNLNYKKKLSGLALELNKQFRFLKEMEDDIKKRHDELQAIKDKKEKEIMTI